MKKVRNFIAAILSGILVISSLPIPLSVSALESSAAPSGTLWADGNPNLDSADQTAQDAVKWFASEDQGCEITSLSNNSNHYYLFLPSTADLNNLTLWHTFSSNPKIGDVEIKNGKPASAIHGTGDYKITADGKTYTLTVAQSQKIGSMYINTKSGSMDSIHADKEYKEKGSILVVQPNGTVDYNDALDHIKGRGNTTWTNINKKPYNIKLNKKASLLGMDTSKKWCLLANGQDHSMLRNKIAFDLADEIGLDLSPDSEYVDLYLNGEYSGVYQVSEKVEEGKNNLVKINDLNDQMEKLNDNELSSYSQHDGGTKKGSKKYFDIPNNPDDITGGYLMEWEVRSKYQEEPSGFVTKKGQYVVVKGPEYASKAQIEYISSFVQDMENAIYSSSGYNAKGKHYSEYLDETSAALMYLLQEYSVNIDAGITSCFFYKDSDTKGDGKIHASPAWDFDVAFGNLEQYKDDCSMTDANKIFVEKSYQYENGQRTIFSQLCQHQEFKDTVKKLYNEKFKPALDILTSSEEKQGKYIRSMPAYYSLLETAAANNAIRWNLSDNVLVSRAGITFGSHFEYLKKFLTQRESFLERYFNTEISKEDFVVYFDNRGQKWDKVYLYYWNGKNKVDWPGIPMQQVQNYFEGFFKADLGALGETDDGNVKIVVNNGYGNGKQTENLDAFSHMSILPSLSHYKTKQDDEALKSFYECTVSDFYEDKVVKSEYTVGDVDNDNNITSADALKILRISVSLEDFEKPSDFSLGDVDKDNSITSNDALLVLRKSVGFADELKIIGTKQIDYSYNKS